jgi:hypothetical protein
MSLFNMPNNRYRPPFPSKSSNTNLPDPRKRAKLISPNVRYERNGLVSSFPVSLSKQALTQHNANTPLLSLPPEIRNIIFKEVLGHRAIHIYALPGIETLDHPAGYPINSNEFALTHVCRQIYADTALLPYSLNTFVFTCRVDRDRWVSRRCFAHLSAITTIEIRNAWLCDAINGTNQGGCFTGCWEEEKSVCDRLSGGWEENDACVAAAQLMPFSLVFRGLERILVGREERTVVGYLAEEAGCRDWKEYVLMREREGVEVLEVESAVP